MYDQCHDGVAQVREKGGILADSGRPTAGAFRLATIVSGSKARTARKPPAAVK
jgi:hypothetical protein